MGFSNGNDPPARAAPDTRSVTGPALALDGYVSKTRRKQQALGLQSLGARLVLLSDAKLTDLALPERLHDAIVQARSTRTHEGRRRQIQFIGRLMRDIDPGAIEDALDADGEAHRGAVNAMHAAERWRDGLLDGSLSLTEFVDRYRQAAAAGLPALLAQARREREGDRPPRQQRNLYRELLRLINDEDTGDGGD